MAYPDAYNKEHQIQNFISFSEKVKDYLELAENNDEMLIKNDVLTLDYENIQTASEMMHVCDAIEHILNKHES